MRVTINIGRISVQMNLRTQTGQFILRDPISDMVTATDEMPLDEVEGVIRQALKGKEIDASKTE